MSNGTQQEQRESTASTLDRIESAGTRATSAVRDVGRVVFGDRLGLALFLGAVLWCGALWRVGIFIQDTVTVANALANVADGHLAILDSPYALTLGEQPGLVTVDGQAYGRNYGHVLLALPLLWVLELGAGLVAPKLLLAGAWSLGLVGFSVLVGRFTGRDRLTTLGSLVALGVFAGNVLTVTALPEGVLALVALQLSTILAAALTAVVLYRLVGRFHGDRVGVTAGAAVVAATPIGFWASIPKRHVVTAAVAVVALYCFAVSRERTDRRGTLARAGAYAVLGLLTTVHPFEAFFLFAVLAPVDLLTAPENSLRTVAAVGFVFALSMLPFFTINTLISGNPIESPRILGGSGSGIDTSVTGDSGDGTASGNTGGGDGGGQTPAGDDAPSTGGGGDGGTDSDGDNGAGSPFGGLFEPFAPLVAFAGSFVGYVTDWVGGSLDVLGQHERLYHIFVRSGEIPSISTRVNNFEAIELTLLESLPLAAALLWLPVAAVRRARARVVGAGISTPRRQTDLLAAGFAIVFSLVYLPKLPLHSQITVRYILPVMPLLVYGVARCSPVHRAIEERPRWLFGSYLGTVVGGGVAMTVALTLLDPAIGEAMQLHALVGLGAALVAAVIVGSWPLHDEIRAVAVGLALPAGVTTVFILLAKIEYFSYRVPSDGNPNAFVLDVVRVLAELLPIVPT
jgi:hypothetical protein